MSNIYKMKCNNCRQEFEFDGDSRRIFCTYCGTEHYTLHTRMLAMEDREKQEKATKGLEGGQNDKSKGRNVGCAIFFVLFILFSALIFIVKTEFGF